MLATVDDVDDDADTCTSIPIPSAPVVYTIAEAARLLKINRKTIDDALRDGRLHAFYPSKAAARITVKQLEDWLGGEL